MKDKHFDCSACGPQHSHDERTMTNECRMCRRMSCSSCLSPEGLCKACPV